MATMDATLVERLYTPEDLPALRRLWEGAYDEDSVRRRKKAFDWITDGNPAAPPEGVPRRMIMDGQEVAGTLGCMPVPFRVHGEPVMMHFSHDLLVDPKYRGQGLAKKLVQKIAEGAPALAGGMWMTGPCYALHQKVGWLAVTPFPGHYFILDAGGALSRRLPSLAAGVLGPFAKAYLRVTRGAPGEGGARVTEVERFDASVDGLFHRVAPKLGITAERTHAYLNWKFVDSPNVTYRRFVIGDPASPVAYVVARRQDRDGGHANGLVVDLLADPDADGAFEAAVAAAVAALEAEGVELAYLLTTYQPFRDRLEKIGFRVTNRPYTYVVTGYQGRVDESAVGDPASWYLTLSDSDGDMWARTEGARRC